MKALKSAIVTLATAAVVTVGADPAWAVVSKSGTKGCSLDQVVGVRAYGTGVIKVYINGSLFTTVDNSGLPAIAFTVKTSSRSISWKVTSTGGYLDDPGTYAWCTYR